MRAKTVCTDLAVSAASSAVSSAILLIAGYTGSQVGEAVPGEDLAFSSSGSAVVAISYNAAILESGDTIALFGSNNYYSDSGSGETFSALGTYTWPTAESSVSQTGVVFLDRVPLAEAVYVKVTAAGASASGTVTVTLLTS